MLALLASLASIAASIGATYIVDNIQTSINYTKNVDSDSILKTINQLIAYARSKGTTAINKLADKLNAIQLPLGVSPTIKDKLIDIRRGLKRDLTEKQRDMNSVEQDLMSVEQRANALASAPEATRAVVGKITKERIIKDLEPTIQKVDTISQEVENYVSKKDQ